MSAGIDMTTVLASAVTAVIVGGSQFVFTRYPARILDRLETELAKKPDKDKNGNGGNK